MITEEFNKKFAEFVTEPEGGEKLKIYDDGYGVPTIGIGFALINKVPNGWQAYSENELKERGINLTSEQYDIIVNYADAKSRGRDTSHLKKQLDDLDFTIDTTISQSLLEYSIEQKYKEIKKQIGEECWDRLNLARQVGVMDHAFQKGNIVALKESLIAGDYVQTAKIMRNAEPAWKDRAELRADFVECGKMEFEGIYIVKRKDTFGTIAKAHNMSAEELRTLNPNVKDPNKISVLQKINVPLPLVTEETLIVDEDNSVCQPDSDSILNKNSLFKSIFYHYKYDYFLNIHHKSADAYSYYTYSDHATNFSLPASSGYFYISLQSPGNPVSYFSGYPYNPELYNSGLPQSMIMSSEQKKAHFDLQQSSKDSGIQLLHTKRIGITSEQYFLAWKYAMKQTNGAFVDRVYSLKVQDWTDFVQSVYHVAGLPLFFSVVYSSSELRSLNTPAAYSVLTKYGSKDTVEEYFSNVQANTSKELTERLNVRIDQVVQLSNGTTPYFKVSVKDLLLPEDLSNIPPITPSEWASMLNDAFYKHFTPNPSLPRILLTGAMLSQNSGSFIELLYEPIEKHIEIAQFLKMVKEYEQLLAQRDEMLAYINFIKFNDIMQPMKLNIALFKMQCKNLLENSQNKSSVECQKKLLTININNAIEDFGNKIKQFSDNKARSFDYLTEILNQDWQDDVLTFCKNITHQEKLFLKRMELLLAVNTSDLDLDNQKHPHHHGENSSHHIVRRDNVLGDKHSPESFPRLLSDDLSTNSVSKNYDVNSTLILVDAVIRMITGKKYQNTNNKILNKNVDQEYASNLAYSAYVPKDQVVSSNESNLNVLEDHTQDIELLGGV